MELHGVKQAELAAAVGVTQGAVSGWCAGAIPKGDQLYQLARFFGVSMESMLAGPIFTRGKKRDLDAELGAVVCEDAPVYKVTDPRDRELRAVLADMEKLTARVKAILDPPANETPGITKKSSEVKFPKKR